VALLLDAARRRGQADLDRQPQTPPSPDAVDRLRAEGVTVIGGLTKDSEVHAGYLGEVLAAEPDLILDNGGDLFARYLDRPYQGLIGGTEGDDLGPDAARAAPRPAQAADPGHQRQARSSSFAENEHAVGQSSVESFPADDETGSPTGSRSPCSAMGRAGAGSRPAFRRAYARVSVRRRRPGDEAPGAPGRVRYAGARYRRRRGGHHRPPSPAPGDVVTAADLPLLAGRRDPGQRRALPGRDRRGGPDRRGRGRGHHGVRRRPAHGWSSATAGGVHLLARGHMFNLAGPRAAGETRSSRWTSAFALQARCLEVVARRGVDAASCVVPVPGAIDAAIARSLPGPQVHPG